MGRATLSVDRAYIDELLHLPEGFRCVGVDFNPQKVGPFINLIIASDSIPESFTQELPGIMPLLYQTVDGNGKPSVHLVKLELSSRTESGDWQVKTIYENPIGKVE